MAIFKVGDRVRIVYSSSGMLAGMQATVLGFERSNHVRWGPGYFYSLNVDGIGTDHPDGTSYICARGQDLEPLTPPGQKEFKAEDILTMPNLPEFKTMTPEFARAWGGA